MVKMKKFLRRIQRIIIPIDPFQEELYYWLNPPENRLEQFEETVHQKDVLLMIQRIQNKFHIKGKEIKVLDIGSGGGASLYPALKRVGPTGEVFGIEICEGCFNHTSGEIERCGFTNAKT